MNTLGIKEGTDGDCTLVYNGEIIVTEPRDICEQVETYLRTLDPNLITTQCAVFGELIVSAQEYKKQYTAEPQCTKRWTHHLNQWCPTCLGVA